MTDYFTHPTTTYALEGTVDLMTIKNGLLFNVTEALKKEWHNTNWSEKDGYLQADKVKHKFDSQVANYINNLVEVEGPECHRCDPATIRPCDLISNGGYVMRVLSVKIVREYPNSRPCYCIHGDYAGGDLTKYLYSRGHSLNGTTRDYRAYMQGNDLAVWYKA